MSVWHVAYHISITKQLDCHIMEDINNKEEKEFDSHNNCNTWKPTMCLRWYETDNYDPINDEFVKVLQQKWQSDTGEEKWEDIEVYGR